MYRYHVERMKATIRCRLGNTLSTIQTLNHWNISLKIPAIMEMQRQTARLVIFYFVSWLILWHKSPQLNDYFLFRESDFVSVMIMKYKSTCCWRVCWCWPRCSSPWSDCWTSASSPSCCCCWGRQLRISGSRSCSWGGGRLQPPRGQSWAGCCICSGGQSICSDCWFSQNSE